MESLSQIKMVTTYYHENKYIVFSLEVSIKVILEKGLVCQSIQAFTNKPQQANYDEIYKVMVVIEFVDENFLSIPKNAFTIFAMLELVGTLPIFDQNLEQTRLSKSKKFIRSRNLKGFLKKLCYKNPVISQKTEGPRAYAPYMGSSARAKWPTFLPS